MRVFLFLALGLALSACAEVTRFKDPAGGSDIYMVDCDSGLRLQSCRAALDSTCPNGYDLLGPVTTRHGNVVTTTKSGYFRCR